MQTHHVQWKVIHSVFLGQQLNNSHSKTEQNDSKAAQIQQAPLSRQLPSWKQGGESRARHHCDGLLSCSSAERENIP